jgi:hypothetical protein
MQLGEVTLCGTSRRDREDHLAGGGGGGGGGGIKSKLCD